MINSEIERANQLELLIRSLSEIKKDIQSGNCENSMKGSFATGVERVLAEISVRIRARHSLPDWVSAAGQILQLLGMIRLHCNNYRTIL